MKSVTIIAIVGILVVSVFAISEIIWYFASQEFEKARNEFKESLVFIITQSFSIYTF
jgi:hypothetical protein